MYCSDKLKEICGFSDLEVIKQYLRASFINVCSTPEPIELGIVLKYSMLKAEDSDWVTIQHPTAVLRYVMKKKPSGINLFSLYSYYILCFISVDLYGLSSASNGSASSSANYGSFWSKTLTWFNISVTLCGRILVSPCQVQISCRLGTSTFWKDYRKVSSCWSETLNRYY